jgi:ribonuclease P protein component
VKKQFTLGRQERLKSRKQTEQLFREGKKFMSGSVRVFYHLHESGKPGLQFGTGASTRLFKKAVDRNRVKRVIREIYRLQKNPLLEIIRDRKKNLNIFFLYTGKELPDYREVFEMSGRALEKLCKVLNQSV